MKNCGHFGLVLMLALAVMAGPATLRAQPRPRVLYLTQSAAFVHEVLPVAEEVMRELGEHADAFEVTVIRTGEEITAERLGDYDVVMFNTTGELPMDGAQKAALLGFIRSGGGFVGVHSASDTFYEWSEYGEMLGGYFNGHPWHQEVVLTVEDPEHPSTRHLGRSVRLFDEIYQVRDWDRDDVHVLLSVDTASVDMAATVSSGTTGTSPCRGRGSTRRDGCSTRRWATSRICGATPGSSSIWWAASDGRLALKSDCSVGLARSRGIRRRVASERQRGTVPRSRGH